MVFIRAGTICLLFVFVGLLQACGALFGQPGYAIPYSVYIDSISTPEDNYERNYMLHSGMQGTNERDLQYQEFAAYVHRALASMGYVRSSSVEDTNIVVLMSYSEDTVVGQGRTHSVILDAIDLDYRRETGEIRQIWKTSISRTHRYYGHSSDFRRVFPIMVAASIPYIGKNTGGRIVTEILEADQQVIDVKGVGSD